MDHFTGLGAHLHYLKDGLGQALAEHDSSARSAEPFSTVTLERIRVLEALCEPFSDLITDCQKLLEHDHSEASFGELFDQHAERLRTIITGLAK